MIHHHPSTNLLAEYSAGATGIAESLAIATHLHYCSECRQQVKAMQQVGGNFFDSAERLGVSDEALTSLFEKIDLIESQQRHEHCHSLASALPQNSASTNAIITNKRHHQPALASLPPVIAKLVGNPSKLRWKMLSPSLKVAHLKTGQTRCEVSLIKIRAGGKVMEHDHGGNEFTVVLNGAFSDANGVYKEGDFLHKVPGESHSPNATANANCVCLTVSDAPIKFTGFIGKLLNPFLTLQPG
ncbi:ChrR family anti-sigma-E factor [Marinibactrum halimedae]|uniref:Transcriptional regulator n=1 Tax=Marinibactrum halimedae TaxID=1444977 RepID=A0AA37T7P2_9GAMM|nr:ChrR family anti-sigma-E factor [Marinibactrum halimedae]MCD9457555.1 ChrR family anti-sigma-E factor [Marinibactrum halimedae]GLS25391.1 transcriptional regulator [Marinibactrum halimedae]